MRRLFRRLLPFAAILAMASGCGASPDNTPTTTTPSVLPQTEVFSGTLTLNGAATYPFSVAASGLITALVNTLSPDSAQLIGIALGTWNGSACQVVLANDRATQGSSVTGSATTAGNFCLRVADTGGTVVQPASYVINVSHP